MYSICAVRLDTCQLHSACRYISMVTQEGMMIGMIVMKFEANKRFCCPRCKSSTRWCPVCVRACAFRCGCDEGRCLAVRYLGLRKAFVFFSSLLPGSCSHLVRLQSCSQMIQQCLLFDCTVFALTVCVMLTVRCSSTDKRRSPRCGLTCS